MRIGTFIAASVAVSIIAMSSLALTKAASAAPPPTNRASLVSSKIDDVSIDALPVCTHVSKFDISGYHSFRKCALGRDL